MKKICIFCTILLSASVLLAGCAPSDSGMNSDGGSSYGGQYSGEDDGQRDGADSGGDDGQRDGGSSYGEHNDGADGGQYGEKGPSASSANDPAQAGAGNPHSGTPMLVVNGELYRSTGRESAVESRCGVMDGQVTSAVDSEETPTEDDQSNFGTGYGYQYGIDDTIEVLIDGKWIVFEQKN